MFKKFYTVFLIVLTTSCTSINKRSDVELKDIDKKLEFKLQTIKTELQRNDLTSLKNSLDVSLIDRYKVSKLSEYDLSKMDIYFTKTEIEKNLGTNIIGIRSGEEIFYFNLKYKYSHGDWKIIKFEERR